MVKPNERPHAFVNGTTERDIRVAQSGQSEAPEGSNQPTRIAVWRPLPDKTVVQPEQPLSEAQQDVLRELKAYTESSLVIKPGDREYDEYAKWEKRFLDTPDTYPRYVKASLGNLEEAKRRLQATLAWRREYRPDLIKPSEIAPEAQEGKVVVNGFDTTGRPVVWLRPSQNTTKPSPLQIRHLVFQLERAIDLCPAGVTKIALIVDYHGATASNNPPTDIAKQVIRILGDHYCERLGRAIVMNVPWYLNAFFALMKPLLDQRTRDKIKFNPEMTDLMPRQQLDNEFGGEHNYQYDPRVYLPALCAFCGIKDDGTREDWIPKDHLDEKPDQIQRRLTMQADELEGLASDLHQKNASFVGQAEEESGPTVQASPPANGEVMTEKHQSVSEPQPQPTMTPLPAGTVAAIAGSAAVGAGAVGVAAKKEKQSSMQNDHATERSTGPTQNGISPAPTIGKKRGGPKLFGSKRGLDKQGNPTIHKHKHISKIFCMHKGALAPSSPEAQALLHPPPPDTIPAESSKGKIRIASDAAESKPYNVPLATNATFGPDAYQTALEAPAETTGATDYFAEARHKAIPVNNHEDRAETLTGGKALMQRLHTDNEEDLTLAYKVLKPPSGDADGRDNTLSFDVLKPAAVDMDNDHATMSYDVLKAP